MAMNIGELVERARDELNKITGLKVSSTLEAVKDDGGSWLISVELIEKHSIPDGMDILGTYEAQLNEDGNLLRFSRKRLRKRIDTQEVE